MKNTNLLTQAQDTYWYSRGRHIASIWTTPESIHELSNEAFLAGAKWQSKTSSQLSPYISQFIEMMILLGYLERETEVENTSEN